MCEKMSKGEDGINGLVQELERVNDLLSTILSTLTEAKASGDVCDEIEHVRGELRSLREHAMLMRLGGELSKRMEELLKGAVGHGCNCKCASNSGE